MAATFEHTVALRTNPLGTLLYYTVATRATVYHLDDGVLRGRSRFGRASRPVGIVVGRGTLLERFWATVRHGIASIRQNPFSNAEEADILSSEDWVGVVGRSLEWIKVQYYPASRPPQSTGEAAARQSTGLPLGWVHQANLLILGRHLTTRPWSAARVALPGVAATRRFLRLQSWVTGLFLRTGASQAFAAYRLLTDTSVWYEVVGQTETAPVWYRIQYDATFQGWVHSAYVELGERVILGKGIS